MDTSAIASLSTTMSMAKLQNEVSMRVLKMAMNQQGQVATSLLESAAQTATEIAQQSGDVGSKIDVTA